MLPNSELLAASVTSDPGTADLQAKLALLRHSAEKVSRPIHHTNMTCGVKLLDCVGTPRGCLIF